MIFWLIVIIILAIIEAATTNLTTIWYIASAVLSLIISIFTDLFIVQLAVFVIVGTILLITTRKILVKLFKQKQEDTNIERILTMKGVVTEKIEKNKIGEVKVDGKVWSAYSDEPLNIDTLVKILEINGVKLKVEKVEE